MTELDRKALTTLGINTSIDYPDSRQGDEGFSGAVTSMLDTWYVDSSAIALFS